MRRLRGPLGRMDGTVSGAVAIGIAVGGLLLLASGAPPLLRALGPALLGAKATARVVAAVEGDRADAVTLAFTTAEGRTVRVERSLSRYLVRAAAPGDELRVAYFAGRPESAQVLDRRADWMSSIVPFVIGAILLLVAWVGRPRRGAHGQAGSGSAPATRRSRRAGRRR